MSFRTRITALSFAACSNLSLGVVTGATILSTLTACRAQAPATRSATLQVGQGINFATGAVTRRAADVDLGFKYLPPQPSGSMQYQVTGLTTGEMQYRVGMRTDRNYPLLTAAKTGSFPKPPDLSKLTVGDINRWTEDEFGVNPGRYLLVRGAASGEHYLVHITRLSMPSSNPKTWRIAFTYKPVKPTFGAAGTAGKGIALSGTLTYREWLNSQKIVDLDLTTGRLRERFDGVAPSRANASGDVAYLDPAGRILLVGADGGQRATLSAPKGIERTFGQGGVQDLALSPDGTKIAVEVDRGETYTSGGISLQSNIGVACVVILDRQGRELAEFRRKTSPTWTADGRLAVAEFDAPGIYLSDSGAHRLEKIPGVTDFPRLESLCVTPTGNQLAFTANHRIWIINRNGSGLRQLTQSAMKESCPAWSPDGRYIALRTETGMLGSAQLQVIRIADGKTITVVDAVGKTHPPQGRPIWH